MADMEEDSGTEVRVLDHWSEGIVWFRDFLPTEAPWGTDAILEAVPSEAAGEYGVVVAENVEVDSEHYRQGEFVALDDREALRRFARESGRLSGFAVPWYDRIVPPALWVPRTERVALAPYREALGRAWMKALIITAAGVAAFFYVPSLAMIALLAATIYGLFPLVQTSSAWLTRVDRLSVEELNRRLINGELFRRWIEKRPTLYLKIGLGVLVLVFVGQLIVDQSSQRMLGTSIEAAALVKERVLERGEWWRLVTTGLMHGSILHIVFNGMALFSLGRVIVALVSPSLLTVVFVISVITGSLASLYLGDAPASVGASGGILGCLGFLLVVTMKFGKWIPGYLRSGLIQSTIVVVLYGLLGSSFIDNAAHAGGFVGGGVLGFAVYPWLRLAPERERFITRVAGSLGIVTLLVAVAKIALELFQGYQAG